MKDASNPPRGASLARRQLLWGAAGLPVAGALRGAAGAAEDRPDAKNQAAGMISRQLKPGNLGASFSRLDVTRLTTPNELFYVRTHFETPTLDAQTWRLSVEGAVEHPFQIGYDELCAMPSKTMPALLECSGNGRGFLDPPQIGIRWEMEAVSVAEWTGVPLAALLERAGVKSSAVEVILEGADQGEFKEPNPKTPGKIPFARSLPLEKARASETLIAHKMNGEPLPPRHGFPVRAVVAGWYGMASVKWLKRIIVANQPFNGFFQTFMYTMWERHGGLPSLIPSSEIQVKSQIARPAPFEVVARGADYRMIGAAWAGEADVTKVEISDDGGKTWTAAKLTTDPVPFAWRYWEHAWRPPDRPGPLIIMARATDSQGRVQPMDRDPDRRDGVISHVLPIEVEVR